VRAFREADFSFCEEALSQAGDFSSIALRARAFIRLGRLNDALDSLEAINMSVLTHDQAAEVLAIKAAALCVLRDPSAESVLLDARVRAYSSGCAAAEGEVEFVGALIAWTQGRVDIALSGIEMALAVREGEASWLRHSRPEASAQLSYWRARAYDLRGLSHAAREDFAAQAVSLSLAFDEFAAGQVHDVQVQAAMLHNLAVLAKDVEDTAIAENARHWAECIKWNRHTAFYECQVFRSLAWCRARSGDHLGAFRDFRRSASVAPSIPFQILAILDRAFLARELGEVLTASDDLDHAVKLASRVDWESVAGAERAALYSLAHQVAASDAKQARFLWNRFDGLTSAVSPLEIQVGSDRRLRAGHCSAHAAVLLAEGNKQRATSLLIEGFQIWSEVGYAWRAAIVALDLAELTGEQRYFETAAREAAKQPHSWLARRLASLEVPATAS
jgi:tetratricopeptide (TPR) repeat protein